MIWHTVWSAVLFTAAVIDWRERRIPDWLSLGGMALALAAAAGQGDQALATALIGGLTALLLFGPIYVLGRRRSQGRSPGGLGPGDIKLAVLVGLITRWPLAVPALLVGILAGGLAALAMLIWHLRRGTYTRDLTMAYGPYLAFGGLVALWAETSFMRLWQS